MTLSLSIVHGADHDALSHGLKWGYSFPSMCIHVC
jgi:hypothetical protein